MSSSRSTSPMANGGSMLTDPAKTPEEFKVKVDELKKAHVQILNLFAWVSKHDRDTSIPGPVIGKNAPAELKIRDVRSLSTQYGKALLSLKKDMTFLKKRQAKGRRTGQGFANPILYNEKLISFFQAAKEEIGTVDMAEVNRLRTLDTNQEWNKRGGPTSGKQEPIPAYVNLIKPDSNYITDQIGFISGLNIDETTVYGIASASILTPLMCIYAAKQNMQGLAQPPQETAAFYQRKFLVKTAEQSQAFKTAKERVRAQNSVLAKQAKANKTIYNRIPLPTVDINNYGNYLSTEEQQRAISTDDWKNGAYLGATPTMFDNLGADTFQQLTAKDNAKNVQNAQDVANGLRNSKGVLIKRRNLVEKPIATQNYFPFAALQVLTSINTVDKRTLSPDDIRSQALTKNTPVNEELRAILAKETEFLSAVLESFNSPNRPGGVVKGKTNVAKRAKKRVDAVLGPKS